MECYIDALKWILFTVVLDFLAQWRIFYNDHSMILFLKMKNNHNNILEIRDVIKSYEDIGKIHLGGIPMIADDMMTFIKNDIVVFGFGCV